VLILFAVLVLVTAVSGQKNDIFDPEQYAIEKSLQKKNQNNQECDNLVELADSVVKYSYDRNTGLFNPVQVTHYSYDSRYNLTVILVISLPDRVNVLRQVFEYDNNDNQKKYSNYNWVDGAWEKTLFVERSHNPDNEITTEVYNRKEADGTFMSYMRHFYNYSGNRVVTYLRQMKDATGAWYDFSYHNWVYDDMGRLSVLYGQYINGPVFWERTTIYNDYENRASQRYLRQLKYDPAQKKNVLTNIVFEEYTYNIFGNVAEIRYHSWINSQWEFTEKAILYYSLIPNKKVNICHNGQQICVSTNAVQAHLEHGDKLGDCTESETKKSGNNPDKNVNQTDDVKFNIFPNPAKNQITIRFEDTETQYTHGVILSSNGVIVAQFTKLNGTQLEYDVSKLMIGYYYIKMYREDGLAETRKLIKK